MFLFIYKKIRSIISSFLIITVLASSFAFVPISHQGQVQVAWAIPVVEVGPNLAMNTYNTVLNTVTSVAQNAFFIKEFTLDGIASGLAKLVLKSITQSILNWINSGFQGSPAFVTDLKQFLLDRADQAAGDFIYNNPDLNFLCSPFQLDVKIALATSYQEQRDNSFASEAQCTLSDVTDNIEGFLGGSFNEGGWASWFEVTQNPINTPTGAYLAAEGNMQARIADAEGNTVRELDWGNGFLSFKVCGDTQVAGGAQKNCTITTPGKVIEDALTVNLQSGTQALIEADEINEIIGALFAQLAKQAIIGINGLLGLGGGSGFSSNTYGDSGGSSYLDALGDEDTISGGVGNPFIDAINLEDENIELQDEIVATINGVEGRLQSAIQTYESCVDITMPQGLVDVRAEALSQILNSSSTVETLLLLNEIYLDSGDSEEQIAVIETYQRMSGDGLIMNESTINQIRFFIDYELKAAVETLDLEISSAVSRCRDVL